MHELQAQYNKTKHYYHDYWEVDGQKRSNLNQQNYSYLCCSIGTSRGTISLTLGGENIPALSVSVPSSEIKQQCYYLYIFKSFVQ